ncbi:MAG: hypothetical protein NVSMB48_13470 [Marmoricola sp.]
MARRPAAGVVVAAAPIAEDPALDELDELGMPDIESEDDGELDEPQAATDSVISVATAATASRVFPEVKVDMSCSF